MTQWLFKRFVPQEADASPQAVHRAMGTLGALTGILANLLLAALKFGVGLAAGSLAVTADAVNNLSDAGGSVMSLAAVRAAQKPMDDDHPFGHGRIEYLGALGVGVLILYMGFELFRDGVRSILDPQPVRFTWLLFALLGLSVIIKGWLAGFFKKAGDAADSSTLRAAAKDSRSDMLATGGVMISMLLGHFFHWQIDGYMGLAVSLIVFKAGYEVCRDTVDRLLGGRPDPRLGRELLQRVMAYPQVLGVHDLVIHDYGPGRCVASLHAEVSAQWDIVTIHEIIDEMEREIGREMNIPLCIHMDPVVVGDEEADRLSAELLAFLQKEDPRLRLHDFRRVPGENQINLIFDVLLPVGYKNEKQLRERLQAHASRLDPRYQCVVHFDRDLLGEG